MKIVLVCVKVSLVCAMMITGIVRRKQKHGKFDAVTGLFIVYIILLSGLLAFEFGTKYIFAFFIMIYVANFVNLAAFLVQLRHIKTPEAKDMKRKTNWYAITMIVCYGIVIVFACFK